MPANVLASKPQCLTGLAPRITWTIAVHAVSKFGSGLAASVKVKV